MTSIGAVVKQVNETLSDTISQLVLYIIVLQEQNADVPENLPPAVEQVGKHIDMLVTVAKQVAEQGYNSYPRIKKKIVDAANAVGISKDNLFAAVKNVQTSSNRRDGWERLLGATKVIAGKTVLLLQIVYGSEIERAFRASELAAKSIKDVDPRKLEEQPEKFVEDLQNSATEAKNVAALLHKKAQGTEDDLLKEKIIQKGNEIDKLVDEIMKAGNELLEDIENPELIKKVESKRDELENALKSATIPLREEPVALFDPFADDEKMSLMDSVDRTKKLMDDLIAGAQKGDKEEVKGVQSKLDPVFENVLKNAKEQAKNTDDPQRKKELEDAIAELEKNMPEFSNVGKKLSENPTDKTLDDLLKNLDGKIRNNLDTIVNPDKKAAEELQRLAEELKKAAKKGDTLKVQEIGKQMKDLQNKLGQQALAKARETDSPIKKRQIMDTIEMLDDLVPLAIDQAIELSQDPKDHNKEKKLDDTVDKLKDELSLLAGEQNQLAELAKKAKEELKELDEATHKKDAPAVATAGKKLQDTARKLEDLGKKIAEKTDDPVKKKQLLDNLKEVQNQLPPTISSSSDTLANKPGALEKFDTSKDKLKEALENLDPTSVVGLGNKTRDTLFELKDAAKKGDKDKVDQLSKTLPQMANQLGRQATLDAKHKDDPVAKKRVLDAVSELDYLIPKEIEKAKEVVADPKNDKLKEQLDNVTNQTNDVIKDLAGPNALVREQQQNIKDLEKAAKNGDVPATEKKLNDIAATQKELEKAAKKESEKEPDPHKKKDLENALKDVNNLLEKEKEKALQAANDPSNPDKQNALEDVDDQILQKLEHISGPDAVLQKAAAKEKEGLEEIIEAAKAGDQKKVDRLADKINPLNQDLTNVANNVASNPQTDPSRKKDLEESSKDLKNDVPKELELAKNLAKNPNDDKLRDQLEHLHDKNKDNLDKIGQPPSAALANKLNSDLDKLVEAAKKGDKPKVDELSKTLPQAASELARQAKTDARNIEDPAKKQDVQTAAEQIEDLVKKELESAKKLAEDPSNKDKNTTLEADDKKTRDALGKLGGPKADLEDAIREYQKDREKLADAVNNNDKKAIDDLNKKLPHSADRVAKKAAAVAEKSDPDTKKKMLGVIDEFKNAANQEPKSATEAVNHPNDPKSKEKFEEAKRDVDQLLGQLQDPNKISDVGDNLIDQLNKMVDSAEKGDQPTTQQLGDKVKKSNDKLLENAQAQAKKEDNPLRRDQMNDAIATLKKLVPEEVELAKQLSKDPNNKELKDKLHDVDDKVKDALHKLAHPEEDHVTAAKEAKDQIQQLKEAAKNGDKAKVGELLKEIPKTQEKLAKETKDAAFKSDNPAFKKQLMDALETLKNAIPEDLEAAKKVSENPTDQVANNTLDKKTDDILKALDKIMEPPVVATAREELDLEDKLKKAKEGNDPKAAADIGKNLLDTQKRLNKEALARAAQNDNPAANKKMLDAVKDLNEIIPEQIKATQDAFARPNDPEAQKKFETLNNLAKDKLNDIIESQKPNSVEDAGKDLKNINDKIDKVVEAIKNNPDDKNLRKQLDDVLKEANKDLDNVEKNLGPFTPEEKAHALMTIADDLVDQLNDAVKSGDQKKVDDIAKDLNDVTKELVQELEKAAKETTDPDKKKTFQDLAKDIPKDTQKTIDAAKTAVKDPKNRKVTEPFDKNADELKKNFKIGKGVARPNPHAENIKSIDDLRKGLKKTPIDAGKPDKDAMDEGLKAILAAKNKLKGNARSQAAKTDDPAKKKELENLAADLDNNFDKVKNAAEKLANNPTDKKLDQDLKDNVKNMEDTIGKLENATNAPLLDAAKRANNDALRTEKGGTIPDKDRVNDATKDLLDRGKKVSDLGKAASTKIDDPARKKELNDALSEIDKLIPKEKDLAEKAAANPNDEKLKDQLDTNTKQLEAALAKVPAAVDPNVENKVVAAIREEQAKLQENNEKIKNGDKSAPDATKKIPEVHDKMEKLAKEAAKGAADPAKKKAIESALDKLDNLKKDLVEKSNQAAKDPTKEDLKKDVEDLTRQMNNQLEKIVDAVETPSKVDALANKKKAANLALKLGAVKDTENLDDLLKCAQNLSNGLGGLLGHIEGTANNQKGVEMSKDARDALETAKLIKEIETTGVNKKYSEDDVDKILSSLSTMPPRAPNPKGGKQAAGKDIIPEVKTVEDSFEAVAHHVRQAAKTSGELSPDDPIVQIYNSIAVELAKMSDAARKGDKKQMVVSGRTISAIVNNLNKETGSLAGKVPDPTLKKNLVSSAASIQSFGTQLKILSTVKAAGGGKDQDEQLITIVKNLGYGLSDMLSGVSVVRLKHKIN